MYIAMCTACLQRGIDLPSLDVAYFTSLSYYMLLLFGLRGVMSLIFKEETIDETQIQKQQMTMGMGNMGQDPQKAFEQERAALDAVSDLLRNHNACFLLGVESCNK